MMANTHCSAACATLASDEGDHLSARCRQGWQASYGLVNLYKDGSECTGSHSGVG